MGPEGGWKLGPQPGGANEGTLPALQRVLKDLFKGAATTVLTQRDKGPLYERYAQMLEAGTKPNLAKLTVARTIAATVSCMWKHEEETQPERIRRPMTTDRGV